MQSVSTRHVFFLGVDQRLLKDVAPLLEPKGLRLAVYESPADCLSGCRADSPSVLVLDLAHAPGGAGLDWLLQGVVAACDQPPGIICLASKARGEDLMERRIAAMRAGASSYLVTPVAPRRLASRVIRQAGLVETSRYRILVVETQPDQAKKIAVLLANAGMEALVLEDPMKLLDRMQAFRPNLILMALHLPGVSGAELARIIRDHEDFFGIPILYLSSEPDLVKQLDALKAGGDGFISKPIRSRYLIAAVEQRIRVSRWLQDRLTLDNRRESANGFLPRDVFARYLDRLIAAGEVQGDGQGLLVIELDAHAQVLESHGIGGTERLLRQMEMRLSRLMRLEESATRLDDFRYALLARREGPAGLQELGDELCRQLAKVRPEERPDAAGTTVSIGVGLFLRPVEDVAGVVARGQEALSGAREAGGNQCRIWAPLGATIRAPGAEGMVKRLISTALAQDGLLLVFQPILPLSQQEEEIYEAQLRLRTLDGDQVQPADFLSAADRGGLMPKIDRWVLGQALEVMDRNRHEHPRLRLLVHQTVGTLAAPDWLPWLRDQIVHRNLVKLYPVLQLQVADIGSNRVEAKQVIERLRTYGIQVCAAGVSGDRDEIALLARLGVKLAKLSIGLVKDMDQETLRGIVRGIKERGIAAIVAGIDDQETVVRVWSCGPDFIQGSYIQTPSDELSFDFRSTSAGA